MRHLATVTALASASALGMAATAAELQRGRIMRGPEHFPAWHYGPNGQSGIFESTDQIPAGWQDHPSKVKGAAEGGGTHTATQSTNTTTTAARAARTTTAKSQTATDPAKAAQTTTADGTKTENPSHTDTNTAMGEIDAEGWPWSADLHASSKSKTRGGLWRMKVGVSRPAPKPGYPLDL